MKSSKEKFFVLVLVNLILLGIILLLFPGFSSGMKEQGASHKQAQIIKKMDETYLAEGVSKKAGQDGKKYLLAYYPKHDETISKQLQAVVEADARALEDKKELVVYKSRLEDSALEGLKTFYLDREVYQDFQLDKKEEGLLLTRTLNKDGGKQSLADLFTDAEAAREKLLSEFSNQLAFRETTEADTNTALSELESQDFSDWQWYYKDGAFHILSGSNGAQHQEHSIPLVTLYDYIKVDVLKGSDKEAYEQYQANRHKKVVALTFDDGPDPKTTPQVLDILKKHKAKATFFVVGQNIAGNESIMKRAIDEGSEIGNHSWSHPNMPLFPLATVQKEINMTHDEIKRAVGVDTNLMRPPYGAITPTIQNSIPEKYIMWSVDTLDWKNRNTESIMAQVKAAVQPGGIILMHDIHQTTVDALPTLLDYLDAQGYEYVTVSDLIGKDAAVNTIYYSR